MLVQPQYRANSPTIYARVDELEFHCIYCQPLPVVEFSLYNQDAIQHTKMQSTRGRCLSTKLTTHNQIP
jgi:hypothetical protein